jgi:formyl-CoA transferase
MARLPLEGVKVLDISQVMAGPYACMLLADLGADVIKIEPPGGGDQTRGSMGFKMKGADSMGFPQHEPQQAQRHAQPQVEAGRAVLLRMAKDADILIENYRPGAMKRLRLGYDDLKDVNPRLVYTSISGFGQTGPWADRPGFDLMAQAMSGVMSVTGYPGGPPVKAGVPVADIGCALFAVYATLAAYIGAKATGQGQTSDGPFRSALAFSVWDISRLLGHGQAARAARHFQQDDGALTRHGASDGYFVMGANNQKLLAAAVQRHRQRHGTAGRRALLDILAAAWANVRRWKANWRRRFARSPKDYLVETLLAAGIPAGPDPHLPRSLRRRTRHGAAG